MEEMGESLLHVKCPVGWGQNCALHLSLVTFLQDDSYLVCVGIVQTGFQTQKEALCLSKLSNVDVFSCSTSS